MEKIRYEKINCGNSKTQSSTFILTKLAFQTSFYLTQTHRLTHSFVVCSSIMHGSPPSSLFLLLTTECNTEHSLGKNPCRCPSLPLTCPIAILPSQTLNRALASTILHCRLRLESCLATSPQPRPHHSSITRGSLP